MTVKVKVRTTQSLVRINITSEGESHLQHSLPPWHCLKPFCVTFKSFIRHSLLSPVCTEKQHISKFHPTSSVTCSHYAVKRSPSSLRAAWLYSHWEKWESLAILKENSLNAGTCGLSFTKNNRTMAPILKEGSSSWNCV